MILSYSMALTKTERGYPSVVEHVGKPLSVRAEMGKTGDKALLEYKQL